MDKDIKHFLFFMVGLFVLWLLFVYSPGRTDSKSILDPFIYRPTNVGEQLRTYNK